MNPARIVHPGFWFGKTKYDDARRWAKAGAGGFCVYWGTPEEIAEFCKEMRSLSPYSNILISADYEDGLGRWVNGAELLPSNMAVGASGEEDLAVKKGLITARQARSIGVDWVFAPVADLACTPDNPIVNTRSFGYSPDLVTRMSMAFMAGMSQGGVLNCLKHFPGHGATEKDSHLTLPVINKTFDELFDYDLLPFRMLLKFADSIMAGHLIVPAVDKDEPASLSEKVIKDLLRKRLNYKGCVLTDALLMKAIGDQKAASLKALKAGVDILLVPEAPDEIIDFVQKLQSDDGAWKDIFISSIATQEMLLAKNAKTEVRRPEQTFFKSPYSAAAAPKCITDFGVHTEYSAGTKVFYKVFEQENFESTPFAKQLAANGVKLFPYNGKNAENLLLVSYSGYRSFKGYVNFTEAEKEEAAAAAAEAQKSAMVSFGSPFVHKDFLKLCQYHVAAYCANEDFQTVCADALCGKVKVTGKLPIKFV
ncbi:MAG: hypothetical protein LBI01_00810 [Elusimicrobium sp.]|jgi:beta-glucosidase-like glycosyl hydrolase|nr:hypothetical protein [Elusimicrobium sp.]